MTKTSYERPDEIVAVIADFTAEYGFPPTVREIGARVGLASTSATHYHLRALAEAGRITYHPSAARTIRVVEGRQWSEVLPPAVVAEPDRRSPTERFWAKVDRRGPDECWPWSGGTHPTGYGAVRRTYAHRVAWSETHGPIPANKWVLHSCDNPPCCNPAHLWLGTARDNSADRDRKGRGRYGPNAPHRKSAA